MSDDTGRAGERYDPNEPQVTAWDGEVQWYPEPIPFEPWPDGEPGPIGKMLGFLIGRPLLALSVWKRTHDRCYRVGCYRRRYRAPGTDWPRRGCPRHDR